MFKHEDIWRGIDRLASSHGYSASGLAKKSGLDPTSFNKSKRVSPDGKPRWPSTESLSKILSVTGATMSDFISLIGSDSAANDQNQNPIPVLGFAQAGNDGYFDEDGYPAGDAWDMIDFPNDSKTENTYALKVHGDSMEPLYRKNDLLIVSPSAQIRRGDRVVVKTKDGEVLAKHLARQNTRHIEVHSLNPAHKPRKIAQSDIGWMARIMWVSQ